MAFIAKPAPPIENTSIALIATNPVFLKGQVIFETDTNRGKVGDGYTAYTSLTYPEWTYEEIPVTAGTDTYTATFSKDIFLAYFNMLRIRVKFTNANTGASTINLNGLGAKSIKKNVSVALVSGDILAGAIYDLVYDGTNFQITSRTGNDSQRLFLISGDQTTTLATAQNITELVTTTLAINSRYYFHGTLYVGCNNTGGIVFAITLPVGGSQASSLIGNTTSATAFTYVFLTATIGTVAVITQATSRSIRIEGELIIGGTAGVAQFQFAAKTATQTVTIFQAGSYIEMIKIT